MVKKSILLFTFILFSNTALGAAFTADKLRFPVTKKVLSNGLTVLFHEDHSAPLISYHTWFRVGSRHEEEGYTGIAHLFEHMMFKGAKRFGAPDKVFDRNGIRNNAFTYYDYTGYYENLPSNKLELVIDVEADRMVNLKVNKSVLDTEREVVREERRLRVENSNMGSLLEFMFSKAYKVHPHRWPVIGTQEDLGRVSVEKCLEFYRKYYTPSNAVIVVAGDFKTKKAEALIEKYYGKIKSHKVAFPKLPQEPPQKKERKGTLSRPSVTESLLIGYQGVSVDDKDGFALDLLMKALGDGPSSRLYKKIVYETQAATGVYATSMAMVDPGLIFFYIEPKPSVKAKTVLRLLDQQIARVKKGVAKAEVEKAKNQILLELVGSLNTIDGKANLLAQYETIRGDYNAIFTDLVKYQAVTTRDVARVAKKYLNRKSRTVTTIKPQKPKKKGGK